MRAPYRVRGVCGAKLHVDESCISFVYALQPQGAVGNSGFIVSHVHAHAEEKGQVPQSIRQLDVCDHGHCRICGVLKQNRAIVGIRLARGTVGSVHAGDRVE